MRGVCFDLYGTLLQYGDMQAAWSAWLTAFYHGLCRHGLTVSPTVFAAQCDRWRDCVSTGLSGPCRDCVGAGLLGPFFGQEEPPARADGFTVFERRIHTLCGTLGLHVPAEHSADIATTIVEVWQHHIVLDPESRPVLQTLQQRYTLALISNFDHPPHVYQVLAALGLVDYFQTILISGEVGAKKPAPQIFQAAGYRNLITEYAIEDTRTVFYHKAPRLADYVFVSQAVRVEDFHVDQTPVSDHAALILSVT